MKGFLFCLIVIVAVSAVRSQPPTRTRKGTRPQRLNDNPDIGLPSGADVPDGRRIPPANQNLPKVYGQASQPGGAAPPPAPASPNIVGPPPNKAALPKAAPPPTNGAYKAVNRRNDNPDRGLPSGRDVPDNRNAAAAPTQQLQNPGQYQRQRENPRQIVKAASPAVSRPNDNPDRGLPSGKDYPDSGRTRTRSGPAPYRPVKATAAGRYNDNPDRGLPSGRDYPDAGFRNSAPVNNYAPPVQPPVEPVYSCDYYCQFDGYRPVCTVYGNEYDNDCYRACRNEPRECENQCPCNSNGSTYDMGAPIVPANPWGGRCDYCYNEEHSPVCVDSEETMYNECFANCEGKTPTCTSACPCT